MTTPLALVDFSDGEKIVGHMFGDNAGAVEQRLGATGKAEEGLFSKLLPMLAQLVMSWLAGRMTDRPVPALRVAAVAVSATCSGAFSVEAEEPPVGVHLPVGVWATSSAASWGARRRMASRRCPTSAASSTCSAEEMAGAASTSTTSSNPADPTRPVVQTFPSYKPSRRTIPLPAHVCSAT
jgi:hypothetical protein